MNAKVVWCASALVILAAGLSMSFLADPSLAQVRKGKTRPALTEHLMQGLLNLHCTALKKELDAEPAAEKAWESVAVHAALLNEASYLLVDDGRCPDGVWYDAATKTLREGSLGVLKAAGAKDLEAARKAFREMTEACKSCHREHRKRHD